MSDDRYRQIFEDLTRDLLTVASKHGKRVLQEAVRDAADGNLIQEDDGDGIPPEELDYPDESVWTLPPAPEDEEEDGEETGRDEEEQTDDEDEETSGDEKELSKAAKKVAAELAEKLERRLKR
ncbi:hypothetical protein [Salinibacter grassmerensis]|uniref:hypothetical protein n=1 Tax=Salinibacter grassmerensis TaxID=3040353 RepID=UPI0021E8CF08|nr:hypothetical protein [Salinibacter grassmerensis]